MGGDVRVCDAAYPFLEGKSMKTRSAKLRERDRRVLAWSLAIAAVLHVAVFLLWPEFEVEPLPGADISVAPSGRGDDLGIYVDLFFGPPDLFEADGSFTREPPDRFLEADRILRLSTVCAELVEGAPTPVHGRVRMVLNASGRADTAEVARSTGDQCGDEMMLAVANDLIYRWLPSDRFPAPVHLIQPITIAAAQR